jgi:predicted MFS family arabinose efflux permease
MLEKPQDNPEDYPALGRAISWVDRPGSLRKIIAALAIICVLTFLADFTYEKHGEFAVEDLPGFYAVFGFVGFSGLIVLARFLRVLIKRPEDFYGNKAVDGEVYPPDQLDISEQGDA